MTVELFGMARALAGVPTLDVAVDDPTDAATLVRALAAAVPQLVGSVVADGALVAPHYLLLDGQRAVDARTPIRAIDRPCVMMLASGG